MMNQCDGFDSPVGTEAERRGVKVWPGEWTDASPFGQLYRVGTPYQAYHTGADLNLNRPKWDSDAHQPVYACASGVVIFAGVLKHWGDVVIVRHDPLASGQVFYSRYGHVEAVRVAEGARVARGEPIGAVGNGRGTTVYHLHFDIAKSDVLVLRHGHWPGMNRAALLAHYVDPRKFIIMNRPSG